MRDFKAFGASIRGVYHAYARLPNQDAFLIRKNQKGLLLVLCDGLGSKKDSQIGAKKLCESVEKALNAIDIQGCNLALLNKVIFSIWECLLYPLEVRNALSTLQLVFIGKEKAFIGKVGDGLLAVLGKEHRLLREDKQDLAHFTTPFDRNTLLTWEVLESKRLQKRLALRCFHHYYSNGSLIFHSQSLFLVSFFPCCFLFFFCFTAKRMALMSCVSFTLV